MMRKFYLTVTLFAAFFVGCISEYEHGGIEEMDSILVVEGIITDGVTTIRLSRSLALTDKMITGPKVNTADVSVVCDDGTVFTASGTIKDGTYNIDVTLEPAKKYCVRIVAGGLKYESDFRYPQSTPEIDYIEYYKEATSKPVEMRVNSMDSERGSGFYLWSFEEIWEITSHLKSEVYKDMDGVYHQLGYGEIYPYYYCWKYANSTGLLLGSTAKQSQNILKDYTVAEFDATGDRFRIMYWMKLHQNMISEDAYEYFFTLKKNSESAGGVFSPIISEMKGNIICTTDPGIPVIGFVDVSYTTTRETFIEPSQQLAEYLPTEPCKTYSWTFAAKEDGLDEADLTVIRIDPNPPTPWADTLLWAALTCVDCRRLGGLKIRPDFWPNDHF